MAKTATTPAYDTPAYWHAILAQPGDTLTTGPGFAGPILCSRQYAESRLAIVTSRGAYGAHMAKLARDKAAVSSVEYALLAAVLAVVLGTLFHGLGEHLAALFHLPVRAA